MKFFIIHILIFSAAVFALGKEDVYKNITAQQKEYDFSFTVDIYSTVYTGNRKINDTGKVVFSPPGRYKITMNRNNMTISAIGDTSWISLPGRGVTRHVASSDGVSGLSNPQSMQKGYGTPDFEKWLENRNFTIIGHEKGKNVVIEIPVGEQNILATYDTNEWLLRKMVMNSAMTGKVETGYKYTSFEGRNMISEVNMTMSAMNGFVNTRYDNYEKIGEVGDEEFRMEGQDEKK